MMSSLKCAWWTSGLARMCHWKWEVHFNSLFWLLWCFCLTLCGWCFNSGSVLKVSSIVESEAVCELLLLCVSELIDSSCILHMSFVAWFSHLGSMGSLSYRNLLALAHFLIQYQKLGQVSSAKFCCIKSSKMLIFVWKFKFYLWQQILSTVLSNRLTFFIFHIF